MLTYSSGYNTPYRGAPVTFQGPLGAASAQIVPVLRGAPVTFQSGPMGGVGTMVGVGVGLLLVSTALSFGVNYLAFRVGGMKNPAKASGVLLAGSIVSGAIILGASGLAAAAKTPAAY